MTPNRPIVLFLCVANSARSQMAEALAKHLAPSDVEVWSAGSAPTTLNPLAVRAVAELGIDMDTHRAKGLDAVPIERVRTVITLCSDEVCPAFPGAVERLHWPFPDPAAAHGTDEERLEAFRRVRDGIQARLMSYFADSMRVSR